MQPGEPPPPELPLEKKMELVANEKLQKAGMFMRGQGDKLKQWFDEVGDDAKKKVCCAVTALASLACGRRPKPVPSLLACSLLTRLAFLHVSSRS